MSDNIVTPVYVKEGYFFQLHGIEFTTSTLDSQSNLNPDGTQTGYVQGTFLDADDNALTTQEDIDLSCVKSIIDWEPSYDYEIMGGQIRQTARPTDDLHLFVIGAPDIPVEYGGSSLFVQGVNMRFIGLEGGVKVDARTVSSLVYNPELHTSKIRMMFTHPVAHKHSFCFTLEIYKKAA